MVNFVYLFYSVKCTITFILNKAYMHNFKKAFLMNKLFFRSDLKCAKLIILSCVQTHGLYLLIIKRQLF